MLIVPLCQQIQCVCPCLCDVNQTHKKSKHPSLIKNTCALPNSLVFSVLRETNTVKYIKLIDIQYNGYSSGKIAYDMYPTMHGRD